MISSPGPTRPQARRLCDRLIYAIGSHLATGPEASDRDPRSPAKALPAGRSVDSRVTERPPMCDRLNAPVIADWRGARNPHPSSAPAIPLARRRRSTPAAMGRGSMNRRRIIGRSKHACGERLRRILDPAVPWCGTGLRRERMHAKRPEGPALIGQRPPLLARAMPAQVKLADPIYPVRRTDRRSASITRLIHLPPPAGSLPDPRRPAAAPW